MELVWSTRLRWIRFALAATLVISLVVTWPVWTSGRDFPLVPVVDFLPKLPDWLMIGLFVTQLCLLGMVLLGRFSNIVIYVWCALFLILCLFDVNRLQPYTFMLGAMLLGVVSRLGRESSTRSITLMRIVVIGVYLWSGIHKLSSDWVTKGFPDTFGQAIGIEKFPEKWQWIGLGVPVVEIGLVIGLLFPRFRNVAAIGFCLMHAFILLLMSPLFLNWNIAIVPWNIGLPVVVMLLFFNVKEKRDKHRPNLYPMKIIYLLIFLVLPALNLIGHWPHYLSFSLFSGKVNQAVILLSPEKQQQLPASFESYIINDRKHNISYVKVALWAQGEMVCLPFPEAFVYQRIYQEFCDKYGAEGSELVLY